MKITTLAEFKRYLADGGKIQLIESYGKPPVEKLAGVRQAEKIQTNAVKFIGGSWLQYPPASLIEFLPADGLIKIYDPLRIYSDGNFGHVAHNNKIRGELALIYKLIA